MNLMKPNIDERYEEHSTLNPILFDENGVLFPEISETLMQIVSTYCDDSEFLKLEDVITAHLVGSNASYNYNDYSDIDLHIIVDMGKLSSDPKFVQFASNGEKALFNKRYDITIKGLSVEVYVEDINSILHSQGVYDIFKNEWVKTPNLTSVDIDYDNYQLMYNDVKNNVLNTLKSNKISDLETLLSNLYSMRRKSLSEYGEYGDDNNIFKDLRAEGIIDSIRDRIAQIRSEELSLMESKKMKRTYEIVWKALAPFKHYSNTGKRDDGVRTFATGKAKNEEQAIKLAYRAIKKYIADDDDFYSDGDMLLTVPKEVDTLRENPYDDTPNSMMTEIYYCDLIDEESNDTIKEFVITMDYMDIRNKGVTESITNFDDIVNEDIRRAIYTDIKKRIQSNDIVDWAFDEYQLSIDSIVDNVMLDVVQYIAFDDAFNPEEEVIESPDYDDYISEVLHSIENTYSDDYGRYIAKLNAYNDSWEYNTHRW